MGNIHSAENAHKLSDSFYEESVDKEQLDFVLDKIKEASAEGKYLYVHPEPLIQVVADALVEFGYKLNTNVISW